MRLTAKDRARDHALFLRPNGDKNEAWAAPFIKQSEVHAVLDKLAAYEDTGLTPETCKDIKSLCDDYVDAGLDVSFILACIAAARAGISSKRMTEISKAETDNRLIILPCNVGDTVYRIVRHRVDVSGYRMEWEWETMIEAVPFRVGMVEAIGKTVFLTRAEAEDALKGE